ncbi:hypothetical protein HF086_012382 [Spodoptera exigua]|uniref:Uncharacterized protein n=1 Tax=Spodoptera exigua TaxID=7107 RepID=A0A922M921_SPOEX|nr:hypothetical protein HF086_012382 [Spodoptera exigua]
MECKSSDSKKLLKVCDAAKHKRTKKKRDGLDDTNSVVTDGSTSEGDGVGESIPQDQDSFIYAFLEEAIKRDKKKQKHTNRREHERQASNEDVRERSAPRDKEKHRHHHKERHRIRDRDEKPSREHNKSSSSPKAASPPPVGVDQTMLLETHKSLQCEVTDRRDPYDVERQPALSHAKSRELVATSRIRSQENFSCRVRSHDKIPAMCDERGKQEKCSCYYEKDSPKYSSKLDISRSRMRPTEDERYRDYPPVAVATRSCLDPYRGRSPDGREERYRDYERDLRGRRYDDDKKRYFEQKTSRSFDVNREGYDEERNCRRTARSDSVKDRRYEDRDKRYEEMGKYYDDKGLESRDRQNVLSKDQRLRRNVERFERNSVASREDAYRERDRDRERERERDRYSERERDSGLSVADGETSTMSGRSNCLKVVKDSAANVKESAAAQLQLWRECMRRYETVARDVGDTDARLMEEIKKQRSEMAEMANMWQECLQRYRDMSNDFNSLKQQVILFYVHRLRTYSRFY